MELSLTVYDFSEAMRLIRFIGSTDLIRKVELQSDSTKYQYMCLTLKRCTIRDLFFLGMRCERDIILRVRSQYVELLTPPDNTGTTVTIDGQKWLFGKKWHESMLPYSIENTTK